MQRTACMAVTVHAQGVSEAFYNGQRDRVVEAVKAEMALQKAEYERALSLERDRAGIKEDHLARVLASNLVRVTAKEPIGPVRKLLRKLESAWAMIWAVAHCWPEMGESLGLWERIEEDGQDV